MGAKTKELTFEIGKYYKHTTGHKLHIVTACKSRI